MTESLTIQGRRLSPAELHGLRQWVGENPRWSRWRLSRELATRWDWRNGAGVLKDMAARTLLVKLAQRGLIQLPARRQVPTNRMRCGVQPVREWYEPKEPKPFPNASLGKGLGTKRHSVLNPLEGFDRFSGIYPAAVFTFDS